LAAFEQDVTDPYFINLDEDPFRSNRLLYIIKKELTTFGAKGDIQLMSLTVVKGHCSIRFDGEQVFVVAGKGDTWRNGHPIPEGSEEKLDIYDRLALGDQLMLFRWKCKENPDDVITSAEDAVEEYQNGLINFRNAGGTGMAGDAAAAELEEERKKIMDERQKWEQEKSQMQTQRNEQEYQRAMASVDNSILDLLPKAKEAKQTVDLLNRVTMTFDVVLEKGSDHVPRVKVRMLLIIYTILLVLTTMYIFRLVSKILNPNFLF
jgi:hypothetical protein